MADADSPEGGADETDEDSPNDGTDGLLSRVSMSLAERRWYYLGVGVSLWAVWNVGTVVGVALGRGVPAAWGLEFAVPLVFLALLVPRLEDVPTTLAGVVAGVVAVLAVGVPFHLGLPIAAVVGVGVGLASEGVAA